MLQMSYPTAAKDSVPLLSEVQGNCFIRFIFEDKFYGTIRYRGPVAGTPDPTANWIGIEWDDIERGKHSGSHQGKSYFTPRFPNSCSFIKETPAFYGKVNFGYSFSKALFEKYIQTDRVLETANIVVSCKVVEAVGYDKIHRKQGNFEALREIALVDGKISTIYGNDDNKEMDISDLTNVLELDLSRNLISNWSVICELVDKLPSLEYLRLNMNRFEFVKSISDFKLSSPSTLKALSLASSFIPWSDLDIIGQACLGSSVEQLCIARNNIIDIQLNGNNWKNLKFLDLESNCIGDWKQVENLSSLPALQHLSLKDNQIKMIRISETAFSDPSSYFKSLDTLNLSQNLISDWQSIDELDKFPALTDVRLMHNPLRSGQDTFEAFQTACTARIQKLIKINNSEISAKVRKDCEIYYVNTCIRRYHEINSPEERKDFLKSNPRFVPLAKFYDLSIDDQSSKVSLAITNPGVIKNSLLELVLIDQSGGGKELRKKLPGTMTVKQLIGLCERLFKRYYSQVSYSESVDDENTIIMDNANRELSFYGLESGYCIKLQ